MSDLHCKTITFPSSDGRHTSSAVLYTMPDKPVRAVIQLSHGMCEYVRRYAPMAEFYAAHGIALAGNDHLGHGDTAKAGEHGHYGEPDGRLHLLNDLHTMNGLLHERFPDTPIILYGHSMGSFYARWYAEKWPESITALVISGTAGPSFMNVIGQKLAGLIARVKGPRYVSPLMVKLNFGSYCKKIANAQSPNAWLSRDENVVKIYDADSLCTFQFTAATYREMLATLNHVSTKAWAQAIDKDLPILLIAGDGDPVGGYGSGKTTLLKISAGLLTPTAGSVLVDKTPVGVYTKAVTSYLPDRMALPTEFTAADAVSLYNDFFPDFDKAKADAMLADLRIQAHDKIGAMSKGTQEKMQLCLTMSRAAKLYLLDEPLGGVDPAARDYILQTILHNYSEDAALVLSTHLIGDIEKVLDEVIFLQNGKVFQQAAVDELREETGMSVDAYFREVYKC